MKKKEKHYRSTSKWQNGNPLNGVPSPHFIAKRDQGHYKKKRAYITLFSKGNICLDLGRRDWWGVNSLSSHSTYTLPCPLVTTTIYLCALHLSVHHIYTSWTLWCTLTLGHFTFVCLFLFYNSPKRMCNVAHLVLFVSLRFSHHVTTVWTVITYYILLLFYPLFSLLHLCTLLYSLDLTHYWFD